MGDVYVPRAPTTDVLCGVVRAHLASFVDGLDPQTDGSAPPLGTRAAHTGRQPAACRASAHRRARPRGADEGSAGGGAALDMVVLDDDRVAAVGSIDELSGVLGESRFTAVLTSDRLSGRKLTTKDPAGDPALRKLTALSTDGALLAGPPVPGNDPTLVGATLTLVDTDTLAMQTIALPVQNWTVRPNDGRTRYVYKDSDLSEGPCKVVSLANGKKLKVRCLGAGIGVAMGPAASAGTFGMRLQIGTSRACMVFGGAGLDKGSGVFVRTDAAAPADCP